MIELTECSFILAPSAIAGIGVFAAHDIPKDALLFNSLKFEVRKKKIKDIPATFIKYCIFVDDDHCICPERFDRMEIGWYINHSDKPNIDKNAQGKLIAIRHIKVNEEILIDYNLLNEPEHLKEDYYIPIQLEGAEF